MVVILKDGTSESNIVDIVEYLDAYNVSVSVTKGEHTTILGLVGDTTSVDQDAVLSFPFVEDVKRIQEPYKAANKKFHPEPTVVDVNGIKIGGGNFQVIAGPCSVESEEQIRSSKGCTEVRRYNDARRRFQAKNFTLCFPGTQS